MQHETNFSREKRYAWAKSKAEELGLRFRTFKVYDEDYKHELGRVTVARQRLNDTEFLVSLTYLSPKDKFSRKEGKYWAVKHILDKKFHKRFTVADPSANCMRELIDAYSDMQKLGWMRKAKHIV